ncbi:MAG: molybdopterin molybdenumtransferase MoeA, partial [Arenimonas sp.]
MSHPTRIAYAQACAILDRVAAAALLDVEDCTLSRALGRVLAQDLHSTQDLPPFDNSAMDGFACRAADLDAGGALLLVGEVFAGRPVPRSEALAAG